MAGFSVSIANTASFACKADRKGAKHQEGIQRILQELREGEGKRHSGDLHRHEKCQHAIAELLHAFHEARDSPP